MENGVLQIYNDRDLTVVGAYAQQTQGIHPMLFWWWADVEDCEPTLKQHCVSINYDACWVSGLGILLWKSFIGWEFENKQTQKRT